MPNPGQAAYPGGPPVFSPVTIPASTLQNNPSAYSNILSQPGFQNQSAANVSGSLPRPPPSSINGPSTAASETAKLIASTPGAQQAIEDFGAAGANAIGQSIKAFSTPPPKISPPAPIGPQIIGYESGIDAQGNRFQKPVYDNNPVSVSGSIASATPDVSKALAGFGPPSGPSSKPVTISSQQLEKTDALRTTEGIAPLEKITPVNIVTTDTQKEPLGVSNPINVTPIKFSTANPQEFKMLQNLANLFGSAEKSGSTEISLLAPSGASLGKVQANQSGFDVARQIISEQPVTFEPIVPADITAKAVANLAQLKTDLATAQSKGDTVVDIYSGNKLVKTSPIGQGLHDILESGGDSFVPRNPALEAQVAQENQQAENQLRTAIGSGIIGGATQFDVLNPKGGLIGTIPADKNSFGSLNALLQTGQPFSIRASNPVQEIQTKQNALDALNNLEGYIQSARISNVKTLDILGPSTIGGALGSQGTKIGTTTPDNALHDVLEFQAKGIPVTLSYHPSTEVASGASKVLGQSGAAEITGNPFGEFMKAGVANTFNLANFLNPSAQIPVPSGIFTGGLITAAARAGSSIKFPAFGTSLYQSPDTRSSGLSSAEQLATQRPFFALGDIAFQVIPSLAPEARLIPSAIKGIQFAKTAEEIGQGLREGELVYEVSKPENSLAFEFSQGTAGKSGNIAPKIEPTFEFGIGPSGEKIPIKTPEEITITSPEKEGPAEIPFAFIGPKSTVLVRSNPQEVFTPQNVLIKSALTEQEASNLGLNKVGENLFYGPLKINNIEQITGLANAGKIKPVTDIFEYPTSDMAKQPQRYAQATRDPGILDSGGLKESLVRPSVIRYFEGESSLIGQPAGSVGGPITSKVNPNIIPRGVRDFLGESVGATAFESELGRLGLVSEETREGVNLRPFTPEDFEIGPGKVGAGQAGKAKSLSEEQEDTLKTLFQESSFVPPRDLYPLSLGNTFFGVGTYPLSSGLGLGNYNLGFGYGKGYYEGGTVPKDHLSSDIINLADKTSSINRKKARGRIRTDLELEILQYPPSTLDHLMPKQLVKLKTEQSLTDKLSQEIMPKVSLTEGQKLQTKQEQQLNQIRINEQSNRLLDKLSTEVGGKQSTSTSPKQVPRSLLTLNLGSLESTQVKQGQQEIPVPTFEQITVPTDIIRIPNTPPPPPKLTPPFSWPSFSFPPGEAAGKKKKQGRNIISFAAYSVNPNIVGAIAQAGLPDLQVSASKSLFGKVNRQLEKAARVSGHSVGLSLSNILGPEPKKKTRKR